MRRWLASFVCLAALACLPSGTPRGGADVIAIVDATIVPMDAMCRMCWISGHACHGEGEIVAPTIYSSGRIVDGDPPIYRRVSTIVRTVDEARNLVDAQVAAGIDVIKVYNNVPTDALQAVIQPLFGRRPSLIRVTSTRGSRTQPPGPLPSPERGPSP